MNYVYCKTVLIVNASIYVLIFNTNIHTFLSDRKRDRKRLNQISSSPIVCID